MSNSDADSLTPGQKKTRDYLIKKIAESGRGFKKSVVDHLMIQLYGLKFDWYAFTRDQRRQILRDVPLIKKTLKQFLEEERREAQEKRAGIQSPGK